MNKHRAILVAALLGMGACAPKFDIVRQAGESPVSRGARIVVAEPRVGDILVNGKPEHQYTSALPLSEREAWVLLLESARQGVVEGLYGARGELTLASSGAGPGVQIELTSVELARVEPGSVPKTTMHAVARVAAPDGKVRDEIRLTSTIEAELTTTDDVAATRGRRFRRAGADLGREVARYLRSRAGLP